MQHYPHLFTPLKIKNVTFRNRIFSTPNQTRFRGNIERAYMEAKARGGAAQVTIGETPVTRKYVRQSAAFTFVLDEPTDMRYLAEIALAIKVHGAVPSIQLYHPGLYTVLHSETDPNPISAMGFTRKDGVEVIAMDEDKIEETVEAYGNAAAMVKRAGFDMCQIHGGHGWLPSQFLSPLTNQRADRWGGSLENRARFPIAVVDRIREKCGADFLIEYRISGDELVEGGMRVGDVIEFLKMVEGKIDLAHISVGVHESRETVHRMFPHAGFTEPGCNVYLAEAVKKAVNIPVITLGGISDPEHAERILSQDRADVIGMARALLADPELPNKARRGQRSEIVPCLRCNNCLSAVGYNDLIVCAANPQTGREERWQTAPPPGASRRVLVVGGGPTGMKAAITAAERGHDVTLVEKSNSLGGLLKTAEHDPLKAEVKAFKNYLVNKVLNTVAVKLNTEATSQLVEGFAPDVVIAAVGSSPIRPPIPGIEGETVLTAPEVYERVAEATDGGEPAAIGTAGVGDKIAAAGIGDKVVVIGGALVGCEVGLYLAELGKSVTIVEMTDVIGDPEKNWRHTVPLVMRMDATPTLQYRTGLKCVEISELGIKVVDKTGRGEFIEADTVVLAAGMRSNSETVEGLRDSVPEFYPVGDCVAPHRILEAMQGGYWAAMDIR
jgi:2,4-dienoyl-CoA reductase-like NADH-dependent reductase (Old Yellow Enzyme family)/thioredoxin reductase